MTTAKTIQAKYTKADGEKSDLITRCEQYAAWTIPHVFPKQDVSGEQANGYASFGAEAVNSLANTIVTSLFRPQQPFFRQEVDDEVYAEVEASAELTRTDFDDAMRRAEKKAISALDKKQLRIQATKTAKLLIITGNALMYYGKSDKDPIKTISIRNYVLRRFASGNVREIIMKEMVDWDEIPAEKQMMAVAKGYKVDEDNTDVKLYTQITMKKGKWHVQQAVDEFDMTPQGIYTDEEVPWRVLGWHRNDEDVYSRGIVEDYSGDFNAASLLSESEVSALALLADKKFGVEPGSGFDIDKMNKAKSGTFHFGRKDSIWAIELVDSGDLATLSSSIESRLKRIQRAFLMRVAIQRDAERVTAEEIRMMAAALEATHGGIYSLLATEWQLPLAQLSLKQVGFKQVSGVEPRIISGMDSLSRAGDMENFNWMLSDLQGLNNIPEALQGEFDMPKLLRYIATNRAVDAERFAKSEDQKIADNNNAKAAEAEQLALEGGITAAGKQLEQA